ncbi:MAG: MarR family transcriptional regulator [Vicinamibacterales bacterium]
MTRSAASSHHASWPADTDDALLFLAAVWQFEHALARASKRMESTHGMSGPQRFAMRLIGERPGVSPRGLAESLHLHPSTITGVVRRLQARGLITRRSSHGDGRVAHLFLTAKGERAVRRNASGTIEYAVRSMLARCASRQTRVTARVLRELTAELDSLSE